MTVPVFLKELDRRSFPGFETVRRSRQKVQEMCIRDRGEIVRTEIAHAGEIVIVPCDSLRLNYVLGNKLLLPRETWSDNPCLLYTSRCV